MRKIIFLFLITVLLSCKSKQIGYPNTLSVSDKIFGLSKFWQEVNYNFVYLDRLTFNLDSVYKTFIPKVLNTKNDYEYYRELERFCALLKDGHTNIYYPDNISKMISGCEFGRYKLILKNINNKAIVTYTSQSKKNEIPIGSEIIEVNGLPTKDYLNNNILPYISSSTDYIRYDWGIAKLLCGVIGEKVSIKYLTPNGEKRSLNLIREHSSESWYPETESRVLSDFHWLDNAIAYVKLNSFEDTAIITRFKSYYSGLRFAKALIIDIRQNGGGSTNICAEIAMCLAKSQILRGSATCSRKHIAYYNAYSNLKPKDTLLYSWASEMYNKYHQNLWQNTGNMDFKNKLSNEEKLICPIALLIGHNTASAAEDFLILLDKEKYIIKIGSNTFGSTGMPLVFSLPGGGHARICSKKDTYPDGREFVGYGIKPDIYVKETVKDYLSKNDPVLNKAIKYLMNKINHP
jgi:C-terminal processing protease CtpA/Prc